MRISSKMLIRAAFFLVVAITAAIILSLIATSKELNETALNVGLLIMAALFYICGHYHGIARGWHEIELRRENPDGFRMRKLTMSSAQRKGPNPAFNGDCILDKPNGKGTVYTYNTV